MRALKEDEIMASFALPPASDQMLKELKDHIIRDEETKKSLNVSTKIAQVSKRLHLAELISRFIKERDA
jgi:hypothetical protein